MIVDDEAPCLSDMAYMLSRYADVEIAGAFTMPVARRWRPCKASSPTCFFLT